LPPKKVIFSFNIKVCLCNQWVFAFSFLWMFVSKLQDDGSGMRAKTKGKAKRRSWSLSVCLRVLLSDLVGDYFLMLGTEAILGDFGPCQLGEKAQNLQSWAK